MPEISDFLYREKQAYVIRLVFEISWNRVQMFGAEFPDTVLLRMKQPIILLHHGTGGHMVLKWCLKRP